MTHLDKHHPNFNEIDARIERTLPNSRYVIEIKSATIGPSATLGHYETVAIVDTQTGQSVKLKGFRRMVIPTIDRVGEAIMQGIEASEP